MTASFSQSNAMETLDWEALKGLTTTVLCGIALIVVIPAIYAIAIRTGWQGIKDTLKDALHSACSCLLWGWYGSRWAARPEA
jgi:hypothetical protein